MINLTLSIDEVNIVIAGLGKLSIEQGVSTWQKIVQQAQNQVAQQTTQTAQVLSDSPSEDWYSKRAFLSNAWRVIS